MSKKYELKYSSKITNSDDNTKLITPLLNTSSVRMYMELMDDHSKRSKKGIKNREDLKKTIYEMLFLLDFHSPTTDVEYSNLIEDGVDPKDIDYDRDEVLKETIEIWKQHFRSEGIDMGRVINV